MGRKPKARSDYIALGKEVKLKLIKASPPTSINTPTIWQCELCGNYTEKSYKKLAHAGRRPCPCRVGYYSEDGKWVDEAEAE